MYLFDLTCAHEPKVIAMWWLPLHVEGRLSLHLRSSTADTYSLNAYFKHQALDNAMLCFLLYASSDYT